MDLCCVWNLILLYLLYYLFFSGSWKLFPKIGFTGLSIQEYLGTTSSTVITHYLSNSYLRRHMIKFYCKCFFIFTLWNRSFWIDCLFIFPFVQLLGRYFPPPIQSVHYRLVCPRILYQFSDLALIQSLSDMPPGPILCNL